MQRPPSRCVAAERARWLAELTDAIDEAQQLAWRLSSEGSNRDVMDLYARLEIARCEVESLRGSGWADGRRNIASEWTDFLPDSLKRTGR